MRYRDLSYEEKRKVVSLVFEEAERMKQEHKRINYHDYFHENRRNAIPRDYTILDCRNTKTYGKI